jgi:hypothetical protein
MARTFGSYSPVVPVATTWEEEIVFQDEDGVAVDLTGYVVESQLRPDLDSESVLDLTSTAGDWSVPTPTNGTILLKVAPEAIVDLVPEGEKKAKYLWATVLRRANDNYRIPLVTGKPTFTRSAVQYSAADTLAP